ncbi:MAG: cell division protein ZipA [Gammaproteobacteria bacterium]|nr:cell division protein ZipA [Gammaproteobacteria bacterium]MDE2346732.1 cell division protein ZipA [Gammaproteobacteria bacterium]
MLELRLILLLIGVVFIAVVYLLSRQGKPRLGKSHRQAPTMTSQTMPVITADPILEQAEKRASVNAEDADPATKKPQLIICLHVADRSQQGFAGAQVLAALQMAGLRYGQYQVFHRITNTELQQSVFSVANMVEPGTLNPESLPQTRIPGLTLFLLLPGPQNAVAACADMLATARLLARQLHADVLDDKHNLLTSDGTQQLRERILEFQKQLLNC